MSNQQNTRPLFQDETVTQVMPETNGNEPRTDSVSGTASSPEPGQKKNGTAQTTEIHTVFRDDELKEDEIAFSVDSSLEFRRTLDKSGDRYRIEKLIAHGGFGLIFRAEDRVLGRKAVVKSLKQEYIQDPEAVKKFIAEAKLNAQLDHPSIVPLYSLDSDTSDGLHLAMQMIRGITLKEFILRNRQLQLTHHYRKSKFQKSLRSRLEIFLHICDAIEYSHNRKVIHNDLKPENIIIGRFGQVYVMDWGIANFEGFKDNKKISGTPAYIAPERVINQLSTKQTDVFSLGMILNELVTLRDPVTGNSSKEVIEKICTGRFEPATCIDPGIKIDPPLAAIINKARHPDPAIRYHDVRSLSSDIRHYLFDEEISAAPDSIPHKIMRFLYRNHTFTFVLVSIFFLILAAAVFHAFYREQIVARKVSEEMLRNTKLQSTVQLLSIELSKRMILLQEQLRNFSSTLAIETSRKHADSELQVHYPFFMNEDFTPGCKKRPAGMIHTSIYKNAVSLNNGTFYLFNPKMSKQDLQFYVDRVLSLHSLVSSAILINVPRSKDELDRDPARLFFNRGSIVRKITCLLNKGLVFCYPGMYHPVSSITEFTPDYIQREQRSANDVLCSPPYVDDSGVIVLTCWSPVLDLTGNKLGAVQFDLTYENLSRPIYEQAEKEKFKAIYTIVDKEERLIYASDQTVYTNPQNCTEDELRSVIGQETYRYPNVLRRIRMNPNQEQFTQTLSGMEYRISWQNIPNTNWILIQHVATVDAGIVDDIDEKIQKALREKESAKE